MSETNAGGRWRELGSISTVMIVGCGRLGSAFAEAMTGIGLEVLPVSARRLGSSADLGRRLRLPRTYSSIPEAAQATHVDLLLLTVPDDAIGIVAGEVAEAGLVHPGMLVAHPSGSHGSAEIEQCHSAGAHTISFHPLQTFPRGVGDGERFQGITFAYEGPAEALPPFRELAFRLGADLFEVPAERKAEYHLAAVLACNCLVSLMQVAIQLFAQVGSLPGESMRRLRPLIDTTLDNIRDLGAVGALTGPVARGDARTVERQVALLKTDMPHHLELYKELSRHLVDIARQREDLTAETLAGLRDIEAVLDHLDGTAG